VTYADAFSLAREACALHKQPIFLLHSPETSDGPSDESYEYSNDRGRVLFPLAKVVAIFYPMPRNAVEVIPATRRL
jgi:hypothetical protein